jgi:EAL domain-containing protein (putative c-di-GMP-specific phosphodiesterase class I)
MATEADPRKDLINRVISALQGDRFVLHSQSIAPLSFAPSQPFQEIFVRYRDEDDNLLPPGSFLNILEEHKLLAYLDRWVINRLARWSRELLQERPDWKVPRSNVNLAAETIVDPQFPDYVRQHMVRSPLGKDGIGFEIDWECALACQDDLRGMIADLRPVGCAFTLADFDASDESFQLLKSFAPHFVKISASTINLSRLAEVNRRCQVLECRTIVEYVERMEMLQELRAAKTDFAQGFALSSVNPL